MQGLIVFINNWSKQFHFGVVKLQVRVNGLPDWEIHESRQTTQLFSANYWGGFHAELFQIKVDSTSGIKHMVICEKSGRQSFHLRREFLKLHTGDTSKYWYVSCYRKVKPSRELWNFLLSISNTFITSCAHVGRQATTRPHKFHFYSKEEESELFRTKDFFENLACCLHASDEAC